jgi:hypothetical protein
MTKSVNKGARFNFRKYESCHAALFLSCGRMSNNRRQTVGKKPPPLRLTTVGHQVKGSGLAKNGIPQSQKENKKCKGK